ncbi:hypothetical protein FKM82_010039 [Ascaphus truei]
MKEIHGALTALGYEIANPGVLVRVHQDGEQCYRTSQNGGDAGETAGGLPLLKPDILLQVTKEELTNAETKRELIPISNPSPCPERPPRVSRGFEENVPAAESAGKPQKKRRDMAVFNPELSLWIKQEEEPLSGGPSSSVRQDSHPPRGRGGEQRYAGEMHTRGRPK